MTRALLLALVLWASPAAAASYYAEVEVSAPDTQARGEATFARLDGVRSLHASARVWIRVDVAGTGRRALPVRWQALWDLGLVYTQRQALDRVLLLQQWRDAYYPAGVDES